jgi:hypothetical protein
VLARQFTALANGIRHFAGFAQANAHTTAFVTHNHQRAEINTTPAFHDLRRTIDENDLLDEFLGTRFGGRVVGTFARPGTPRTAEAATATGIATTARTARPAAYFRYFSHNIIGC